MADRIKQPKYAKIKAELAEVNLVWDQTFDKNQTDRFTTVQKFIDSKCIRRMVPYTPMRNGILMKNTFLGTKIGSGYIVYISLCKVSILWKGDGIIRYRLRLCNEWKKKNPHKYRSAI